MAPSGSRILSHDSQMLSPEQIAQLARQRIENDTELAAEEKSECLSMVNDLCDFELGRFFLANQGGLNGYWTWYLINRPNMVGPNASPLEDFLAYRAPVVLATRERFYIFQQQIENRLFDGIRIASLPCGVMQDLLTLNLSGIYDFSLVGIDLDGDALAVARQAADTAGLAAHCEFMQADAWHLDIAEPVDILTSNGLNIYEADDDKVTALYRSFRSAIKPGGMLVSSFLTESPLMSTHSPWRMNKINADDLMQQKKILVDTMRARWSACYRSHQATLTQLQAAGFVDIQFFDGSTGIFPTFTARRPFD